MEIDHTFTNAAEEALRVESAEYAARLRETAIKEALTSRGTPVEVTASDVKRAAKALRAVRAEDIAQRFPASYKLLTAYFWGGIAMSMLSLLFLSIPAYFSGIELPFSSRIVGLIGLQGAFLAAASAGMRWRLRRRLRE